MAIYCGNPVRPCLNRVLLPLVIGSARPLSDSVAVLLCCEGAFRWQLAVRHVVNYVVRAAVLVLFFLK